MRWLVLGSFAAVLSIFACFGSDPATQSPGSGLDGGPPGEGGITACAVPPRCSDDGRSLVSCEGTKACSLGCDSVAGRCKVIAPSGAVGTAATTEATADIVLGEASTYWFDTSTGAIGFRDATGTPSGAALRSGGSGIVSGIGFEIVTQSDASKIGVWSFRSFVIAKGATAKVYSPSAMAIVTSEDLVVDGTISVAGDCTQGTAGPGAAAEASTWNGKQGTDLLSSSYDRVCSGGSGGGNGTRGGDGASASSKQQQPGAVGGLGRVKTLIDEPLLVGGGRGGSGGRASDVDFPRNPFALGGPGGGAVQLVASGTLTVSGRVDAAGCGGKRAWAGHPGSPADSKSCAGGGGGGAGGTIFLEAPSIRLTKDARVLANGGGGGGGTSRGNTTANPALNTDGTSNSADAARAPGGASDDRGLPGACAPGQSGNVPPTEPFANPCNTDSGPIGASGGGGGSGSIATRTSDATIASEDGGIISPAPTRSTMTLK